MSTDPDEPRFAGSVAWVPAEPEPTFVTEPAMAYVDPVQPFETVTPPVVDYGPAVEAEDEPARIPVAPGWVAPVLAMVGGILAVLGSLLTWSTLQLSSEGSDTSLSNDATSRVTYNGLSLLEGRLIIVFGVVAFVLGALRLSGWLRPTAAANWLALIGAIGLIAVGFAAIGHPVELATLFRSYDQIDTVKVSLPDGVGVWVALGGAALILISGLLARMNEAGARG